MEDNLSPQSSKLTKTLIDLGSRTLVLVEGKDDQAVFEELFFDYLDRIAFHEVQGDKGVKNVLNEIIAKRPDIPVFGICDRDFADDAEIEARLQEPQGKLFKLTWYSIENYLLDSDAIWSVLRVWFSRQPPVATVNDISEQLMEMCRQLKTMMAANWVLREANQDGFAQGHEILSHEDFVDQIQKRIGCLKSEAKDRLAVKEAEIEKVLTDSDIEVAYTRISGKHLRQRLCVFSRSQGKWISPIDLFNLLLEWLKNNKEPHPHLRRIIDEKILASQQPSA